MKKQKSNVPNADISSLPRKPLLKLDWCSHEAAKYAVEHWHYSKCMPRMKLVKVGVWENEQFIGCVIFSCGASNAIGKPYGLSTIQVCELTRVALHQHVSSVTRIVSVALKFLHKSNPGLRLVVSFADPAQGHHGGIYQGGNWIYTGRSSPDKRYYDKNGGAHHSRNVKSRSYRDRNGVVNYARSSMVRVEETPGKHRYLYPLDADMRQHIQPLSKPYPKRATSIDSDATVIQTVEGGVVPTVALQ